jgi:hypothetical protein
MFVFNVVARVPNLLGGNSSKENISVEFAVNILEMSTSKVVASIAHTRALACLRNVPIYNIFL